MKLLSSKRRVWTAVVLAVLLLFLVRPGVSRLKSRVVLSISSALGRNVDVAFIHLRLLPWPGFELENLVVYDDHAFGAEPMLRAGEVNASLRLSSLLRGRLEVSRLDLSEPSLNLVQEQNGRWNLEALLERASQTPLAPTAKAKSEPRFAFPYIEASSARINFKKGAEKKPYALTNADFSLWQESENSWGVRLTAQPIRSDLNLNDTGVVRVDGRWQRAATLRETPLDFTLAWDHPQLGQLTKLFTGIDRGWRGGVQAEARLTGTPAELEISSDASIQDFRRYDITSGHSMRLAAKCRAQYSSIDRTFHDLDCSAPVGEGSIRVTGDAGMPASNNYKIVLVADKVPAGAAVGLGQLTKQSIPDDLIAGGLIHATVSARGNAGGAFHLDGKGAIVNLHLASAANKAEIGPETVPFLLTANRPTGATSKALRRGNNTQDHFPDGPRLEFGPFQLGNRGAVSHGWMNRTGYTVDLTGETTIASAVRAAHLFGIPALPATPDGTAQVDFQIQGAWGSSPYGSFGFAGPQVTGTARLHNVRVAVRGAAGPLEIVSGELHLNSDTARLEKLAAKAAGNPVTGWLETPRGCGFPAACPIRFNLNANNVDLAELRAWASPPSAARPWYRVIGEDASTTPAFLTVLQASGRLTADHMLLHGFSADGVAADVSLSRGKLEIRQFSAEFLAGSLRGGLQADFNAHPNAHSVECTTSGTLADISLSQLAGVMQDNWVSGTANGTYQVRGTCGADFWKSAEGSLQFDIRDGGLPHISLSDDEGPLKILRLSGQAKLHGSQIDVADATLDAPGTTFKLSGTASLDRTLDLKLTPAVTGTRYAITGTVTEPRVVLLPGVEQARLKPESTK